MAVVAELASLPSCAKDCLQASCSLNNLACVCWAETLNALEECVRSRCSIPEGFYSRKYTSLACRFPVRDHGAKLNIITFTLSAVTLVCIVSRILFKQFLSSRQRLDKDDWTIMSAIPTGTTLVGLVVFGITRHGLGTDIWGVPDADLRAFGAYFFAISTLYMVLMVQIKLSLCFFYLNIFPGTTIRRLLWVTVGFHVVMVLAFVAAIFASCSPFSFQWERYYLDRRPFADGQCVDLNAAGWVHSTLNVASDLWLIAMPLTQVGKLNLHIKKKIGIVLMFLTGALVTIISMLRLNTMKTYNHTTNPTWDEWSPVFWSAVEICTGFICTSLPTVRLILIRIAPRTFGSDRVHSQDMAPLPQPRARKLPLCSAMTLPKMNDYKGSAHSSIDEMRSQRGLCEEMRHTTDCPV
ncbi:hypothetical protein E4U41_006077 [Claviceps citrina]|nr:hypothetical protein E4U41_006077 [Claviceps citrina]